jgi:hypothetical protein
MEHHGAPCSIKEKSVGVSPHTSKRAKDHVVKASWRGGSVGLQNRTCFFVPLRFLMILDSKDGHVTSQLIYGSETWRVLQSVLQETCFNKCQTWPTLTNQPRFGMIWASVPQKKTPAWSKLTIHIYNILQLSFTVYVYIIITNSVN